MFLQVIKTASIGICLTFAHPAVAFPIFTSQADFNASAASAGHVPVLYGFNSDPTGVPVNPLTGGLFVAGAGIIDNIGPFGANHFDGSLNLALPTAVTFAFPTLVRGWGADFLSTESTGPSPNNDLVVQSLLGGSVLTTYSFAAFTSGVGGHLSATGDGFFGGRENVMFDSIRFSLTLPLGSGGESWEMDNLQTFVPEPGSAAVLALNVLVVALMVRRGGVRQRA